MPRKVFIAFTLALLFLLETAYFSRQCAAGLQRLVGERAFFRNDHRAAWRAYRRARALGGDPETIETDQAELLLFGLDQVWAGARVSPALSGEEAVEEALRLVANRIAAGPSKAYIWGLASDVYFHQGRLRRQASILDLSLLGDDPMKVLRPEEQLGVAALETAARLEPHNCVYQDLLVEKFLELGLIERAKPHVRRAVAAYPTLYEHSYLLRADLDPQLVEAAMDGFADSTRQESLIPAGVSRTDAGELLRRDGQVTRSIGVLEQAVRLAPDLYEAHYDLGIALYTLDRYRDAITQLREASRCLPDSPSPHVHMGLAFMALGDLQAAIEQFRSARQKGSNEFEYFRLLGEALEKAGQIEDAERQFVAAAHLSPGSVQAWAALLFFYTRHRELRPASDVCARLESISPGDPAYTQPCALLGLGSP